MPQTAVRKLLLTSLVALSVSGCGLLYKQPVYQGNLIDAASAEQLQVGMSREQVQTLLGTPSISDPFHHQRWDYTATQRVGRRDRTEVKTFTVFFESDAVARWDGEYFPEQNEALAAQMRKFGNLPRERNRPRR